MASRSSARPPAAPIVRLLLLLTTGCSFLAGCLAVPVRTPRAVAGPKGNIKKFDTKFLAPGTTSRREVLDKLDAVNAAPGYDRFLWARWKQSKWAVAWMAGGPGAAAGGANRVWGSANLLVLFDEDGTVKEYRHVSDGQLTHELREVLKDEPAIGPDETLEVLAEHRHHHNGFAMVSMHLTPARFRFDEPSNSAHSFELPPDAIIAVDSALHDVDRDNVMDVEQTIHFRAKTKAGDKVSLRMTSLEFIKLLRYLNQYCPNAR